MHLQTSKVLNYIDHPLGGPYFAFFIGVWIYMRHYLNIRILLSEFYEFKTVGPYELNWVTGQYKCDISHWISTALLGALQCLNLFWLYYIFRIAIRFVWFKILDDDRSDDDESELEEAQDLKILKQQKIDDAATPTLLINGKAVANNKASGLDIKTNSLTNRKENAS